MTNDPDSELVRASLAGDPGAFGALVDRYQFKLFNAAYRITGSQNEAMDATQAAFVKAYEKLHTFDPAYRFFSWIYRIGINESLNAVRLRRREQDLPAELPETARSPEDQAGAAETSRAVQAALMKLREDHRVALVLRHFHGLSYADMAQVLELPEKTVKSRLFEARRTLKVLMLERGLKR